MTIKKLEKMPYAQAHVEIDKDGNISLFSYLTKVAEISEDKWFTIFGLYSMTTRKHIGAFVWEYVEWPNGERGTFQEFRKIYEDGYKINLETGEIQEIENEE